MRNNSIDNGEMNDFGRISRHHNQTPNMFTIGNYKNKVQLTSSPAVEKYQRGSFFKTPMTSAKKNSVTALTPGAFFHNRQRN